MTKKFSEDELVDLHKRSFECVKDVKKSIMCGCFHCCEIFAANMIEAYVDNGKTPLCPLCEVDAVLPDATVELTFDLVDTMYRRWFSREK